MGIEKTKKVAIIGAGAMAQEHIKAFKSLEEAEVCGIYSRTYEKAQNIAHQYNIPSVCNSIDELYKRTNADYVVITVSVLEVAQVITECVKYNWKILAEKPAGHNFIEASKLLNSLQNKAKDVFVALNRRTNSSSLNCLNEIEKTKSRRIIEISDQQSIATALEYHPEEVAHNWMYANSIHLIDLANYFCRGEVSNVTNIKKWAGIETDFVLAHIEYNSGDEAIYRCYYKQPAPWSVVVSTEVARYEMRPLEKLFIQKSGERSLNEVPQNQNDTLYKAGFVVQAQNFLSGNGVSLEQANSSMQLTSLIYSA